MRILVVEDERPLRNLLVQALREDGHAVDWAEEGVDGAHKALGTAYDLLVLDVMLPGMDGWEILAKVRREKPTPVLFLTARDTVDDRVKGLDLGADDYLVKPFALTELLARVRALGRRRHRDRVPNHPTGLHHHRHQLKVRSVAAMNRSRSPPANTPSSSCSPPAGANS